MIKKVSVFFLAFAFLLNGVGTTFAASETKESAAQNAPLVALLPASEAAINLNMKRLVSAALPQILSSNQLMLGKILGTLDEIKGRTGIDLRQFEQIAVGVSSKKNSGNETVFEPVMLARGTFNAGALLSIAKIASKGKYREEKIGERTVYIFSIKELSEQNKPKTKTSNSSIIDNTIDKVTDKILKGLAGELAVTSYDNNTLAIGSTARVRETFEVKTRIGADVLNLINRKPNQIMNFGAKLPNGLSQFIDMENDEIGKNLGAIRQISGAADVGDGRATVSLAAKTLEIAQAKSLQETLEGLQMVGKAFIGGAKGADKKVYARMIDNAKISQSGNEVLFDLQVAQNDIDILVGAK